MLQNNLDAEVAERPQDLVVYGGIGRAARNWECFDQILASLHELEDDESLLDPVGQAGRRVQDPRERAARADRQLQPGAQVGHLGAFQRARPQGPHDVRPDDRRQLDLHRQPGHRAGHLRDLRRSRPPALRQRSVGQVDPHRRPRRHGRRAAAGRRRWPAPARSPSNASSRASISACARATSTSRRSDIDDALALIAAPHANEGGGVDRAARQRRRNRCPSSSSARKAGAAIRPTWSPTRPPRTI